LPYRRSHPNHSTYRRNCHRLQPATKIGLKDKVFGPDIDLHESAVEDLSFENDSFDGVLRHFSIIFARHLAATLSQMLHILKPNCTLAFSTLLPNLFMVRFIQINAKYVPPVQVNTEP